MALLIFKTLHIIGFVSWMAGLFYLVRMFVYHEEAYQRPEGERKVLVEQFSLMHPRVYRIICNPAMMFTWFCGVSMLILNPAYMTQGWMHIKLTLLILLLIYHLYCKSLSKKLVAGQRPYQAFQYRLLNEVPTVLLVAIAFLGVLKSTINYYYLAAGLVGFGILIYGGAKAYQKKRLQAASQEAPKAEVQ
ncbi:MAG: protoporphyrinogen oxidase HemJ [Bacteroidota bacterium]